MGIIALEGIEIYGRIGVSDTELRTGKNYIVDIEVDYPISVASRTDMVEDTLDYGILANAVNNVMAMEHRLLEHAARNMAEYVLDHCPEIPTIRISIRKLRPFLIGHIGASRVVWRYPEDWE